MVDGDEEEATDDDVGDGDKHARVWDPVALEEELAELALAQSTGDYEEERRRAGAASGAGGDVTFMSVKVNSKP